MPKLLLHTCCGPCFLGVWEDLKALDFEVTNFYFNPNIQPKVEYKRRFNDFKKVIKGKSRGYIEGLYNPDDYISAIHGIEDLKSERCLKCYYLRLSETAKIARKSGYGHFSTTLLVSPYQNREALLEIGRALAEKYQLKFLDTDWRPHFRRGQKVAGENRIYRQKYCGCLYSLAETGK